MEQLADPVAPVAAIVARVPHKRLQHLYNVPPFDSHAALLAHIAAARGKLRKGGAPDVTAAARIVLNDWNDGRISHFTRPPVRGGGGGGGAAIVGAYAAEFDAEKVFKDEENAVIAGLRREADGDFVEAATGGAVAVRSLVLLTVLCGCFAVSSDSDFGSFDGLRGSLLSDSDECSDACERCLATKQCYQKHATVGPKHDIQAARGLAPSACEHTVGTTVLTSFACVHRWTSRRCKPPTPPMAWTPTATLRTCL